MKHARPDYDAIQDSPLQSLIPFDEPVFLIRGQDKVGANAVRAWAALARKNGADEAIVQMALNHADKMEAWPKKKTPDLPAGAAP